jgi:antitoxin StbD
MSNPVVAQVQPLSEVRKSLSGILARFRREGARAVPVVFGSHRKPEGVLIPYAAYERYEALSRPRAQPEPAESPDTPNPNHEEDLSSAIAGEISADELYRRMISRTRPA